MASLSGGAMVIWPWRMGARSSAWSTGMPSRRTFSSMLRRADERWRTAKTEAGSAVGKALKKSWACLSSLFTDCK